MKINTIRKVNLFFKSMILLAMASCATGAYYQMHTVTSEDAEMDQALMQYRQGPVVLEYNFWAEKGSTTCKVTNLSDSIMYLYLDLSHLIMNGQAMSYYRSEINQYGYTPASTYQSNPLWNSRTKTAAVFGLRSRYELNEKIMVIPPKSYKFLEGRSISELITHCDLLRYADTASMLFQHETTPVKFSNFIGYSFKQADTATHFLRNNFWVSRVSNYYWNKFMKEYQIVNCGKRSMYTEFKPRYKSPNKYYIKYYYTY